jgi:hypothetical protein
MRSSGYGSRDTSSHPDTMRKKFRRLHKTYTPRKTHHREMIEKCTWHAARKVAHRTAQYRAAKRAKAAQEYDP